MFREKPFFVEAEQAILALVLLAYVQVALILECLLHELSVGGDGGSLSNELLVN